MVQTQQFIPLDDNDLEVTPKVVWTQNDHKYKYHILVSAIVCPQKKIISLTALNQAISRQIHDIGIPMEDFTVTTDKSQKMRSANQNDISFVSRVLIKGDEAYALFKLKNLCHD